MGAKSIGTRRPNLSQNSVVRLRMLMARPYGSSYRGCREILKLPSLLSISQVGFVIQSCLAHHSIRSIAWKRGPKPRERRTLHEAGTSQLRSLQPERCLPMPDDDFRLFDCHQMHLSHHPEAAITSSIRLRPGI